jgi:membrane protein implicated in regulation of membrane protease activity
MVMSATVQTVLLAVAAILLVMYLARRRSRLGRED